MRRQVAWDEKASAGETERVPARRIVDSAGIRGPEPRVGLRVTMSADGRAVCAAHGFFCPDGDGEGTVRAAMGGSVAVDWDCGKRGDYLVGQYNQYMLLVAPCGGGGGAVPGEVPAHTHRAPADGAASADLELSRPWWKGTPHVAAFTPGSTKPANGRLVRVAVRVDGEPNEILVPTGYILPPEPHFRLEAGEIVRIRGLVNAPQYNGMLATRVTSGGSDASGGKVCVELLATSKQLQVSLEKIEPIPGADVDGEVLRVCPWWNSSQVVRIQGTGTRLDGASALVVGFEVVTEVEQTVHGLRANAASAPQRLPLSSVVAHSYHLAMQCTEGQDLQQSYRLMASALVQARLALTLPCLARALTLTYPTLPYLALPYFTFTLPYFTIPCLTLTLPCFALPYPYLALLYLAVPFLTLPCLNLTLPYLNLTLLCLALPCPCLNLNLPYLCMEADGHGLAQPFFFGAAP